MATLLAVRCTSASAKMAAAGPLRAVVKTVSKEVGTAGALYAYYFVPVSFKNMTRAGLRKWRSKN